MLQTQPEKEGDIETQFFNIVKMIVARYGGKVNEINIETNVIDIDVPKKFEEECARKIAEEVDLLIY
jgi:hypothetical protein